MKKFYVTTPIYYANDIPHVGHAYTTIAADILARWNKLLGNKVFFLTGTDEHGKKVEAAAREKGKTPKEFVDELIPKFKEAWKKLNIDYDHFIRTTDSEHEKIVREVLQKVYDNRDIYLGEYEGLYCTACEAYYTEKDLVDDCCPIHKRPVEKLKEPSYFFGLSKYQNKLLELYKKNPEFISPEFRKKEIINRVKEGLQDLSISRTSFDWGIKLPFNKQHITYVWFDALLNYYSATKLKGKSRFWPPDLHLMGKEILWFHAVYWPAMLMSAGIKLPKKIFAHGWWTFNKEKIAKSGKMINVDELISIAGVDSARYFLFRNTSFGDDGDFSKADLISRHNNELADKLGNLVSRVSALIEMYGLSKSPNNLLKKLHLKEINQKMANLELDKALNLIFAFIDICNEYAQNKKPWETHNKKILYELADSIKAIAILLSPFIPSTSEKIAKQFSFKLKYGNIKKPLKISKIRKGEILFRKIGSPINKKPEQKIIKQPQIKNKIEGIITMNEINFSDWEKLDLRVGKIAKVEDIEGVDKLYKLTVDLGSKIGKRTVCAGLKHHYSKDELKNKKIILFVNLMPRKLKGIESQGMVLAAVSEDESKVILLAPEKDIEVGSKVR